MSINAMTLAGNEVKVDETSVGTACRQGRIYYGCVMVAYYCNSGSDRNRTLRDGLAAADKDIIECGLNNNNTEK